MTIESMKNSPEFRAVRMDISIAVALFGEGRSKWPPNVFQDAEGAKVYFAYKDEEDAHKP